VYQWAKETTMLYCSKEEIDIQRLALQKRFSRAFTIYGTKGYHAYLPTPDGRILKICSDSSFSKFCKIDV